MNPVNTIQCNVMMEREGCNTLPAKLNPKEGTVETYWEPTVEERAALSYGANVRLSVMGMTMPPVMLDVSYVGENGPVLFYKDTLEKVKLAEKLDEAKECNTALAGDLKDAQMILKKIREVSECPEGMSLIAHIESMVETIELLSREDDEEDDDDDEEDDWWKSEHTEPDEEE